MTADHAPSKRFLLSRNSTYAPQYSNIYFARLQQLRPHVQIAARATFGDPSSDLFYADTIVEATAFSRQHSGKGPNQTSTLANPNDESPSQRLNHSSVVITGVVFRQMQSKPSILAQYDHPSPHTLIPDPPPRSTTTYVSSTGDQVFIEDEHARCKLDLKHVASTKASMLITGFVVAVRGRENHQLGTFTVLDVTFANPAPLAPRLAVSPRTSSSHRVCLVSGLGISSMSVLPELLLEALRGTFDGAPFSSTSQIVHTVIAGNLLTASSLDTSSHLSRPAEAKTRHETSAQYLDRYLLALAATMPVTVMPGYIDTANALLPQQPLHRCLLPNAARCSNLSRASNPHAMTLGGVRFVGTSGQNVFDLALYEEHAEQSQERPPNAEEALNILENLVRGRHLAPTCPDTLGCYPFVDSDPFVLDETPHVLFVGNQREFGTRMMSVASNDPDVDISAVDGKELKHGNFVRLISVPCFARTGQVVFLDLSSLECSVHEFALPARNV